jgi:hypothetical protein
LIGFPNEGQVKLKFIKWLNFTEKVLTWPKIDDIAVITKEMTVYRAVKLVGSDPFLLKNTKNIEMAYVSFCQKF